MGRWGSDVVALACIAGGAIVGSGVTAALVSATSDSEAERVEVVCASTASPRVVVRLSSGSAAVSKSTIQVHSRSEGARCGGSAHFNIAQIEGEIEEVVERAELARLRLRFEGEVEPDEALAITSQVSLQRHAEQIRELVDQARLQAEQAKAAAELAGDETRQEAVEASMRKEIEMRMRELHEVEQVLERARGGSSVRAETAARELGAALELMSRQLEADLEKVRGAGGND